MGVLTCGSLVGHCQLLQKWCWWGCSLGAPSAMFVKRELQLIISASSHLECWFHASSSTRASSIHVRGYICMLPHRDNVGCNILMQSSFVALAACIHSISIPDRIFKVRALSKLDLKISKEIWAKFGGLQQSTLYICQTTTTTNCSCGWQRTTCWATSQVNCGT